MLPRASGIDGETAAPLEIVPKAPDSGDFVAHVAREELEAKFWLRPVVLAANFGFRSAELSRVERLVRENQQTLLDAYIERHGIRE